MHANKQLVHIKFLLFSFIIIFYFLFICLLFIFIINLLVNLVKQNTHFVC